MKHMRAFSLILVLVLALGICACGAQKAPADAGPVTVQFTVTHPDGTDKVCRLEGAGDTTLADALAAAGLISADEAAAGFVTVVDGVEAKWEVDKGWWQLMDAAGRSAMKGIGQLTLAEAEGYAFVYTID